MSSPDTSPHIKPWPVIPFYLARPGAVASPGPAVASAGPVRWSASCRDRLDLRPEQAGTEGVQRRLWSLHAWL